MTIIWGCNFILDLVKFLEHHLRFVQSHAWARNTRRTLNSQAKAFKEFTSAADIEWLPVTPRQLCWYAIWLYVVRGLKSPKSIRMYLSAVRTMHRKIGLTCATPSTYGPLEQCISGLKRLLQHRVKKAKPITPVILRNLLLSPPLTPLCPTQAMMDTTFRALTLLLFQSMLRSSNMMPENRHDFDARYVLKWGNVEKVSYGVLLTITISKTNQFGEYDHLIPLAASPDSRFCPVRALETLARMYGPEYMSPDTPVFLIPTPSGRFVPLKKQEFVDWLRSRLAAMGLPAEDFSVHSFRHGGVQQCVLNEPNKALVQLASGHSSEAIMGYAQIPPERRMAISAKVNRSLASDV